MIGVKLAGCTAPAVFFNPVHALHSGQIEFLDQKVIPSLEDPARMTMIVDALQARGFGTIAASIPQAGLDLTLAHTPRYLDDLAAICRDVPGEAAVLAATTAGAGGRIEASHPPQVRLGRYVRDTYTSVGRGTFEAAVGSVGSVWAALGHILGGGHWSMALGRPPHHHAGPDNSGGYCYLNGTALAALHVRNRGLRCAVLDVDFHHGNGTQEILYDKDILFCSIHGDPRETFPHYTGFADEAGIGRGEGFNLNIPLQAGTAWSGYREALDHAIRVVRSHAPDILIVSLGVDTFAGDPVGRFRLKSDDFLALGAAIGRLGLATLFVLEGGYAVREIGTNVANVLEGYGSSSSGRAR